MENSNPYVSVIIPTYHDWERLQWCIDALADQSYPEMRIEILIINNDPNDKVPESFNIPKNAKILLENKVGSYAARNKGLISSIGEIIVFTDSDCIPEKDWIKNALKNLSLSTDRLAGKIELFFSSDKLTLAEIYEKAFAFDQELNASKSASVTANMITWRKSFDVVGLFDENLMSGGDYEWSMRATKMGLNIQYVEDVVVKHPARNQIKSILKKKRRVVGGVVKIENNTGIKLPYLIIKGLVPPYKTINYLRKKKELNLPEKTMAFLFLWFLEIYGTLYKIGHWVGYKNFENS